jgi:hypothetical protein
MPLLLLQKQKEDKNNPEKIRGREREIINK